MTLQIVNFAAQAQPSRKVFVSGAVQDGNGNPVPWAMVQFGGVLTGGVMAGSQGTFAANVSATGEGQGTATASAGGQQSPAASTPVSGPVLTPQALTAKVTGPDGNGSYTVSLHWVASWTVDLSVGHGFQWMVRDFPFGGSGADTTTAIGAETWDGSDTAASPSSPVGANLNLTVTDSWGITHVDGCTIAQG